MARETISGGSFKMLPTKEGEAPIEGFLKGVIKEQNKFGNDQYNFLLTDRGGHEFKVMSSGSAKYFANNVAMALGLEPVNKEFGAGIEAAKKALHKWVIISFDGTYTNKRKQEVRKYVIETDSDIKPGDPAPASEFNSEQIPF